MYSLVKIMPQNNGNKNKSEFFLRARQIGILTAVPLVLPLGPLIGYFLGHWIDQKFGIDPFATIVMILLGVAASVRETIRMIREALRQ